MHCLSLCPERFFGSSTPLFSRWGTFSSHGPVYALYRSYRGAIYITCATHVITYRIQLHLYSTPLTDVPVFVGCLYSYPLLRIYPTLWVFVLFCPLLRFCPTSWGLYIIMSSSEVLSHFVGFILCPLRRFCPNVCWVHVLLCPLRRFLFQCLLLCWVYILLCPLRRFLSQRLLGCGLVCLATQSWIRGDNLSAIASPCEN